MGAKDFNGLENLVSSLKYFFITLKIWLNKQQSMLKLKKLLFIKYLTPIILANLCGWVWFDWQQSSNISKQPHNCLHVLIQMSFNLDWCMKVCDITFFYLTPTHRQKHKQKYLKWNKICFTLFDFLQFTGNIFLCFVFWMLVSYIKI